MRWGCVLAAALAGCAFEGAPPSGGAPDARAALEPDAAAADAGPDAPVELCGEAYASGYRLIAEPLPWADARNRCLGDGADLVVIGSAEEHLQVAELRQAAGVGSVWIGASDDDQEGTWSWIDQTPVDGGFEAWEDREPNDGGLFGGPEDCAEQRQDEGDGWNDEGCGGSKAAVCECSDSALSLR